MSISFRVERSEPGDSLEPTQPHEQELSPEAVPRASERQLYEETVRDALADFNSFDRGGRLPSPYTPEGVKKRNELLIRLSEKHEIEPNVLLVALAQTHGRNLQRAESFFHKQMLETEGFTQPPKPVDSDQMPGYRDLMDGASGYNHWQHMREMEQPGSKGLLRELIPDSVRTLLRKPNGNNGGVGVDSVPIPNFDNPVRSSATEVPKPDRDVLKGIATTLFGVELLKTDPELAEAAEKSRLSGVYLDLVREDVFKSTQREFAELVGPENLRRTIRTWMIQSGWSEAVETELKEHIKDLQHKLGDRIRAATTRYTGPMLVGIEKQLDAAFRKTTERLARQYNFLNSANASNTSLEKSIIPKG